MISVKKDFNKVPQILKSGKEEAWRDESVLDELKRLYHGKCAYCEAKTNDLNIDHYRPESRYPWLKNEWSNLLPICPECNMAKKDKFPVKGKHKTIQPINEEDYRADSEYLLSEEPLIIHPEVDTAGNHFYFEKNGVIQGYTERGRKTISSLNLYREYLTEKKNKLYKTFYHKLKAKIIHSKSSDDFFKLLKKASQDEEEFSLFGKQLCYQFETFLYNEVVAAIDNSKHDLFKDKYEEALNSGLSEQEAEGLQTFESDAEMVLAEYFNAIFGVNFGNKLQLELINPLSVIGFSIKKFQGINEATLNDIPVNTQWIFLTGENGFGKTSVLKALLLGLIGKTEFKETEINENARIALTVLEREKTLIEEKDKVKYMVFGSYLFQGFKKVAAYGAVRTFLNPTSEKIPTSANLFASKKPDNVYVLNTEALLERLAGKPELEPFKNQIIESLKFLIPKLSRIEIIPDKNKTDTEILYYEKDNDGNELPPVSFDRLAMGMRNIIGLTGDIIQRLSEERTFTASDKPSVFEIQKDPFNKLSDLYGIVLIDEFDNHLHPEWQRDLVKKLSELFPKVQFIVSTHSPVPLLGAPPERTVILNVDRTKETGITIKRLKRLEKELPDLLPNAILTSPIFGLNSIKSEYNENIDNLVVDDNYYDREKYDKLDEKIDELFKENNWADNKLFKE